MIAQFAEFHWSVFELLRRDRPIGMSGAGPIPVTSILTVAKHFDLDRQKTDQLLYLIARLDDLERNLYAKQNAAKQAKTNK